MPKKVRLDQPAVSRQKGVSYIDSAIVCDLQRVQPGWSLRGVKVNDISPLWPFSTVREIALKHAAMFKEQMEGAHSLRMLTAEADVQVWGPFRHKVLDTGWKDQLRKRADPVTEPRNTRRVPRVIGLRTDEMKMPELADFYFVADFVAEKGYVNEEPTLAAA